MSTDDALHHPTRAGQPDPDLTRLGREWQAASERTFGSAMNEPLVYQRTARIIGAFVALLREEGRGLDALVDHWNRREQLLAELVSDDGRLSLDGLDPQLLAGAAFAIRHREAHEESAQMERLTILARSADLTQWVTLEETGYAPGDPFVPYRRLEALPANGTALLIATEPDEELAGCVHTVQVLHIDVESGILLPLTAGDSSALRHSRSTAEEREALVDELKATWTAA